MINAHTHLYSGLAPFGLPEPEPAPQTFLQVLERFWWRLDRALDAEMLRASARYYVAHARHGGTTGLIDHLESPDFIDGSLDVIADACQELGVPAVLGYGVTERNGGRLEAERGLAECQRFIRDNDRPLVRGIVGVHASFTVSDDTLKAAGELCREMSVPLHLHAAEDLCDVEDARARGYDGVVARLEALGALPAGSILAHGVHLTAAEVGRLHALDCWLVQNPRSNVQNRVGYPASLGCSPLVALGTDGFPSDMAAECSAGNIAAAAHGENAAMLERRLASGDELLRRLFRGDVPVADRRTIDDATWDAIEHEAAQQAARLATAMRAGR